MPSTNSGQDNGDKSIAAAPKWRHPWWIWIVLIPVASYSVLLYLYMYVTYLSAQQIVTGNWVIIGATSIILMPAMAFFAFYGNLAVGKRRLGIANRESRLRIWLLLHSAYQILSNLDFAIIVTGSIIVANREPTFSQQLGIAVELLFLFVVSFVYRGSLLNIAGQDYDQLEKVSRNHQS